MEDKSIIYETNTVEYFPVDKTNFGPRPYLWRILSWKEFNGLTLIVLKSEQTLIDYKMN